MNKKHPSSSHVQLQVEDKLIKKLEEKYQCSFSRTPKNTRFSFDFYNEEKRIMGEVYAGIDKISTGSKRKVIADCFKLVAAENILGGVWKKYIVFVDDNIKKKFEGESWIKDSNAKFGINLITEEISEEDKDALRAAKNGQQIGNKKK